MAAAVAVSAFAQSTIRVEVHNIVELSERFNVVFVVEGEHSPSDFQWDAGDDFTVVWGPQKGTSTSVQITNGHAVRNSQTSYTYILQAKRVGRFLISPATATVRGETITSRAVTVQVVYDQEGGQSGEEGGEQRHHNQQQQQQQQQQSQQSSQGQSRQSSGGREESGESGAQAPSHEDIFMRLSLSRSSVVLGEPVIAALKIYHKSSSNLVGFEDARFTTFGGFWSQEVDSPTNIEFQRETLDGVMYNSALLRRWVIIPQRAGDITIEPSEIVCLVNEREHRRSRSIFDDFFDSGYVTVRKRVVSGSPTLHVEALPTGTPASFSGGVGQYTVQARLSKDSLKTHDAASLIVTVQGRGNLSLLEAPRISFPPDFEVYDVRTSISADRGGINGTKTFEYPFIPRSHGDFTMAPVQFAYYDVQARGYRTAQTDSLRLHVQRSANDPVTPQGSGLTVDRKGVRNLGEDIRFIHPKTTLGSVKQPLVATPVYWICVGVMLLAAILVWLFTRRAAARRADVAGTRNRKAARMALSRLHQAREYMKKDLPQAFYEELHRSLLGFTSDKLGMDMAQISKENISAALVEGGVSEAVANEFVGLLDECEFARYSPDGGSQSMNTHYEKAVKSITAISSSMKKKPARSGASAMLVASLLILSPLSAKAQDLSYPDSLWNAGVEAYTAGQWSLALEDWEAVRSSGAVSAQLYYNLGNAYYKTGEIGKAILWYERAAKLSPEDADVRYNLEFARASTQDRIDSVPEFFLRSWIRKASHALPGNVWAVLSLVLFAAALSLGLLFLLGSAAPARRTGFFCGIAALLLSVMCFGFAARQRSDRESASAAVVMRAVSSVKSSPSADASTDLFILHEGTKVEILDAVAGYTLIELADGRQGWISTPDIEII